MLSTGRGGAQNPTGRLGMSDRLVVMTGDCLDRDAETAGGERAFDRARRPPYWGLRDYGIAPAIWGGVEACAHLEWGDGNSSSRDQSRTDKRRWTSRDGLDEGKSSRWKNARDEQRQNIGQGSFCQKCNAWRGVFGLEPTPELYIEHLVMIMREAKRVLRKDGTLWVNLGDSYCDGSRVRVVNPGG
jgi:Ni/Co efflux regulator RcnB